MDIKPHITEKSLNKSKNNVFTLIAPLSASKGSIVDFLKRVYKTKVLKITSIVVKGKTKRVRNKIGRRKGFKKFIVKLPKKIKIEGFEIENKDKTEKKETKEKSSKTKPKEKKEIAPKSGKK